MIENDIRTDDGVFIRDLEKEFGIRSNLLYYVIVQTPRWQEFGRDVVSRKLAISEALENITKLAQRYEHLYLKNGSKVYSDRAELYKDYARKLSNSEGN